MMVGGSRKGENAFRRRSPLKPTSGTRGNSQELEGSPPLKRLRNSKYLHESFSRGSALFAIVFSSGRKQKRKGLELDILRLYNI
jgi:hypothetical protein